MFVQAKARLYHGCIREEGEYFEVPDTNGESPNYKILTKAQAKKLGLASDPDEPEGVTQPSLQPTN